MNTNTTVLNAVTVAATATSTGNAASVDLTSLAVNDIVLEATIVNNVSSADTSPGKGKYIEVWYAWSSASLSTAIPQTVGPSAQKFIAKISSVAGETRISSTDKITKRARYINVWVKNDILDAAVTLTLKAIS